MGQGLLESPIAWTPMQAKFLAELFRGGRETPSRMAAALGCSRQYVARLAAAVVKKATRYFAKKKFRRLPLPPKPRS